MNFTGFSIPDGAYIPPELIYLLPHISGSKLKVLFAVLYQNLQIGSGEPSSLTDIENLTGLSRQSVITSLRELLEEHRIDRQAVGNSYVYFPVVKFLDQRVKYLDSSVKKLDHPELRESERELNSDSEDSLSDSLNLTDPASLKIRLVKELRAAGVFLKTAQAIVEAHDEATIERHMNFYRYALEMNLAQGPGWLVMSLKEDWPAPIGYKPNHGHLTTCQCEACRSERNEKYSEWEKVGR